MTVPNPSPETGDHALQTGTENQSRETENRSQATSVALIHSWPLTVLAVFLLPLLLSLGSWQLQRAEEKRGILRQIDARLATQPQQIQSLSNPQRYTPVRLLGYYTDEYLYLDNRTRDGRVGYEILQVFVSGDQRWLINRGWLAAEPDRAELPPVSYPLAAKVINGFLYPNTLEPESGPAADNEAGRRIQSLSKIHADKLNLSNPLWHIRLSADSDTALTTGWRLLVSTPERHTGYAVQWFAMAAALLVLWLLAATNVRERFFRRKPKNK